jgi:NAD(P)-dependent dehydrogenase (short-subunit alcohol dehydrogenase family)
MSSKVALVTASSAGLGAATAKEFAKQGYKVVINYHFNKERAEAVLQEIIQSTKASTTEAMADNTEQRYVVVKGDMSNKEDIKKMVKTTIDTFGRLDVVVSNQGWTRMRNFRNLDDNMDESDWDTCFNFNVKSHLHLFHAARPHLAETKGAFITVASLAGVIPSGSSIVSINLVLLSLLSNFMHVCKTDKFCEKSPTRLQKLLKSISSKH